MIRRIRLVGLFLAVMFGASGCTLFEDGSYRTETHRGCLFPEWGCSGPSVELIELIDAPVPSHEVQP